jgi:hypothetical protein
MTIQRALQLITSLLKHHLHAPKRLLLLTGCNVADALIDSVSSGAVCRETWGKIKKVVESARVASRRMRTRRTRTPCRKLSLRRGDHYPGHSDSAESYQQSFK